MTDSADEPLDGIDARILTELAGLLATVDPVPTGLVDDVEFAISLAAMNAELATLSEEPVPVRGATLDRVDSLTFTSSTMTLMVIIDRDGPDIGVSGWVSGGGVQVELIDGTERRTAVSDLNGRLTWPRLAGGTIRFLIHPLADGGRSVITPGIEL